MRIILFDVALAGAMYSTLNAAMGMEAQMEMSSMAVHQKRLAEFGMSFRTAKTGSFVQQEPAETTNSGEWKVSEKQPETGLPEDPPQENRMHHWMRLLSFAFLLKAGAICSSVLLTLSPLRVVWQIQAKKSTMSYPPFTFFCVFACGLQWCIYGTFAFVVTANYGFLILVYSNILGVIMGCFYCYTYHQNITEPYRLLQFQYCLYAAVVNYGFQATVILNVAHPRALLIVGTLSAFYSVLVSFAPIADVQKIFVDKDVSGIPSDVVGASFIASALWFGCALLLHDTWILVPNFFGLILGACQLFLLAYYGGITLPSMPSKMLFGQTRKGYHNDSYGTMEDQLVHRPVEVETQYHMGGTGGTGDWD